MREREGERMRERESEKKREREREGKYEPPYLYIKLLKNIRKF